MPKKTTSSRRGFIKTSALAGAGLLLGITLPVQGKRFIMGHASGSDGAAGTAQTNPAQLNAFLQIHEDNTIAIILSKLEMGQGIVTTLPMLIAEELDCDWKHIKVLPRPPGRGKDFGEHIFVQTTGGSDSTRTEFDRWRMAGATAREMLISAAATQLGVAPGACSTANGYVIAGNQRIPYGAVATAAARLPVPVVMLRPPKQWKLIGKAIKRVDSPEKVNGQAIYGIDIRFPGLLTALMAYPPVFGAKLLSFDATDSKKVPGVRAVVQIPAGIAVLADNFWAAKKGKEALVLKWDTSTAIIPTEAMHPNELPEIYNRFSHGTGVVTQQKGNVAAALATAKHILAAEYFFPFLAHAPMETINCTVRITGDTCEIWTGSQSPLLHQQEVAAFLGIPVENVTWHTPYLGGSFGRRGSLQKDWVLDAVQIAQASGQAIKLIWSREDDIRGGYYRPAYHHRARIAIGADELPAAWEHHITGQSLFTGTPLEKEIVFNGIDYGSIGGVQGSPYLETIPDHRVELHTTTLGIPVLPWRSVSNTHTAFVMETLVDELAHQAGQDPVDYRRRLFRQQPRLLAVLNLAAEKAGWGAPLPGGRHRGIAVHGAMGSCIAQVIEIAVDNGKLSLHKVVCAIDCGLAVNPSGVCAQMEGAIIYGLTAALYGEITLKKGRVEQSNFHDYRMLRMHETPAIEVHILPSTAPMGGAGEPGVPPIAPALANAIFAATGKRIRELPINKKGKDFFNG